MTSLYVNVLTSVFEDIQYVFLGGVLGILIIVILVEKPDDDTKEPLLVRWKNAFYDTELKNPVTRFVWYFSIFLIEVGISIIWYFRTGIPETWDDFFPGPRFLNLFMVISFGINSFRAYRNMIRRNG
jgi:hypothetical protein